MSSHGVQTARKLDLFEHVRRVFGRELRSIREDVLREKVVRTWVRAMRLSGSTDLERDIPSLKRIARTNAPQHGLGLEHVRSVVRFAEAIAAAQGEAHGLDPDMDVVLAGALLHDVGKLLERAPPEKHPLAGSLVKHAFSGVHLAMLEDVPAEVMHVIAYHAAEGHRVARTLECHIVHVADELAVDAQERKVLGAATPHPYLHVPEG